MLRIALALLVVAASIGPAKAGATVGSGPDPALEWAYPRAPKNSDPEVPPGIYHVEGSGRSFTAESINNDELPDWFPDQHPVMPSVVARSRPQGAIACAACHLVNGEGFMNVPNLSGLSAAYITEQVREFQSGRRQSAESGRPNTQLMIGVAKVISDQDLAEAAQYYSSLPKQPRVRVIETDTVPATRPNYFGWTDLVAGGGTEPIRGRVIEVAEDFVRMLVQDPHFGIIAYVPKGAIQRGAELSHRPGQTGQSCALCHGADFLGTPIAPPLAGRSPSYLARTLYDLKTGARTGSTTALMQPVVAQLNADEMTDLAAYLASLPVKSATH